MSSAGSILLASPEEAGVSVAGLWAGVEGGVCASGGGWFGGALAALGAGAAGPVLGFSSDDVGVCGTIGSELKNLS